MHRGLRLAALAVLPLSLLACGGDDDASGSDVRQQVIDEITEDGEATPEQAGCVADGMIAQFGEGRVRELLALDDDTDIEEALSADEQSQFARVALGCVDAREMLTEQLTATFSQEDAECIVAAFDDDTLQSMMETAMGGGTPDESAMMDAVLACGVTP